jgi:hypothetical protein
MPTCNSSSPRPTASPRIAAFAFAIAILASFPATSTATLGSKLPPQGMYEGCSLGATGDECVERLASIRAAGFRYVLNYSAWYGSPAEVLRYADAAAALGLQLIWPLNNPAWRNLGNLSATYSSLAEHHSNFSNPEFISLAIELVANHPATWGFYIGDELPATEASRVRELSTTVRLLAPHKPQLYVARPGIDQLRPFAGLADVAGANAYPIGSGDPLVRQAAQSAHVVTSAAGAQTAMVLQAFSWSQYAPSDFAPRYPSQRSLREMRDAAIDHAHPTMILWYSYQDILRSDRPEDHWRNLVRAALTPLPDLQHNSGQNDQGGGDDGAR